VEHGIHIHTLHYDSPSEIDNCDGFITKERGIASLIKHADCQACIMYDPIQHIVANIHAGWRGSVQNIYATAIKQLGEQYNSQPENLLVCISPSLGPSAAEFSNYKEELPESMWEFQDRKHYFNFWEISRSQLIKCGILPHHIEIAEKCTYSNEEDYFSYRREGLTGRHGTIVLLR